MEQARLERELIRCRYLLTKGAVQRLGVRDMEAIAENWDSFIRECHAVYKKAQAILTRTMLELETEIEDLSRSDSKGEALKKHVYWLRVLESCYEAFLWVALHSDVHEIYKGPKYGRLPGTESSDTRLASNGCAAS